MKRKILIGYTVIMTIVVIILSVFLATKNDNACTEYDRLNKLTDKIQSPYSKREKKKWDIKRNNMSKPKAKSKIYTLELLK